MIGSTIGNWVRVYGRQFVLMVGVVLCLGFAGDVNGQEVPRTKLDISPTFTDRSAETMIPTVGRSSSPLPVDPPPPPAPPSSPKDGLPLRPSMPPVPQLDNPVAVVQDITNQVPGFEKGISTTLNIIILLTVLSLAPSILILCTCFTRIMIVLALLRQAMGTQQLPPSQVITGISLFLTFMVMAPTMKQIHEVAIDPFNEGKIDQMTAWVRAKQPLRDFMFNQLERTDNWGDVYMIMNYRGMETETPGKLLRKDVDMLTLIPSFILSELKTAFLIGFRLYLPFLVIDMVIASLLISMGMMMLPPVLVSLPFKLLLFVIVDGWRLVVGNLLGSFQLGPPLVH